MEKVVRIEAVALDISEHGAKLEVGTPIGVGQAVAVEFRSRKDGAPIIVPGKVAWSDEATEVGETPTWVIGVDFAGVRWHLSERVGLAEEEPGARPRAVPCVLRTACP